MFMDMMHEVHIDEKWYYITKESNMYYLHKKKKAPLRTYKSKRFIEKIMFMGAIARPRYDQYRKQCFNDKIGL
jgi:hypothetical protein